MEYPGRRRMVSRALQEMLSGRRGPAALEMPWDVSRSVPMPPHSLSIHSGAAPDIERVKAAAALIAGSRTHDLRAAAPFDARRNPGIAELIDAPVVAFRSGRGIVSNADELGLTMAAAYRLWPHTAMIGIGTRLELPTMSRQPFRPEG